MKREFLDLGKQPIANGFLYEADVSNEFFFHLRVVFDDETKLVSLKDFVKPELMFNDDYVYVSSMSQTMRTHFKEAANSFIERFDPTKVLEIGSNDGVFVKNFNSEDTIAVEPCGNFAKITNDKGYHTYPNFWTSELASEIVENHGKQDLIFSANCMCHIQDLDDAFDAINTCLADDGVFVFEDPSLEKMISRNSYDQIYDEHAHIFSVIALDNILRKHDLQIFHVENLDVHGGSNRIFVKKTKNTQIDIDTSVNKNINLEKENALDQYQRYVEFASNVKQSKNQLLSLLKKYKKQNKKIVSYGATSKSTTVFNYCGITTEHIDYIVDTTPYKQGKLAPGSHIPVVSPEEGFNHEVDVAFLGAWNFSKEIYNKESEFINRGGVFISHIPEVVSYLKGNKIV
jgi:methylation protein EvaC